MNFFNRSTQVSPANTITESDWSFIYNHRLQDVHRDHNIPLNQPDRPPADLLDRIHAMGSNILLVIASTVNLRGDLNDRLCSAIISRIDNDLQKTVIARPGTLQEKFDRLKAYGTALNMTVVPNEDKLHGFFGKVSDLGKEALVHGCPYLAKYYSYRDDIFTLKVRQLAAGDTSIALQLFFMRAHPNIETVNLSLQERHQLTDRVVQVMLATLPHLKRVDFSGATDLTAAAFEGHPTLTEVILTNTSLTEEDFPKDRFPQLETVTNPSPKAPRHITKTPQDLQTLLQKWAAMEHCAAVDLEEIKKLFAQFPKSAKEQRAQQHALMPEAVADGIDASIQLRIELLKQFKALGLRGDFFVDQECRLAVESMMLDICIEEAEKAKDYHWVVEGDFGKELKLLFDEWFKYPIPNGVSQETKTKFLKWAQTVFISTTNTGKQKANENQLAIAKMALDQLPTSQALVSSIVRRIKSLDSRFKPWSKNPDNSGKNESVVIMEMGYLLDSLVVRTLNMSYSTSTVRNEEEVRALTKEIKSIVRWFFRPGIFRGWWTISEAGNTYNLKSLAIAGALIVDLGARNTKKLMRDLQGAAAYNGEFVQLIGKNPELPASLRGTDIGAYLLDPLVEKRRNERLAVLLGTPV